MSLAAQITGWSLLGAFVLALGVFILWFATRPPDRRD